MKLAKCNKDFVSEIDQFLQQFDAQNPQLSPSQRYEINKYQRVNHLRDHVITAEDTSKIWEEF